MQKLFVRWLSFFLVLVFLFQMAPLRAFATADTGTADDGSGILFSEEPSSEEASSPEPAEMVGEVASLRTEDGKHFRLSDGSFLAVSYGTPVHFQDEDGQWQDIDNTLTFRADTDTYATAENGEAFTAFSADLSQGRLATAVYGDASVSMSLLRSEQLRELLTEEATDAAPEEGTVPEESAVPEEEIPTAEGTIPETDTAPEEIPTEESAVSEEEIPTAESTAPEADTVPEEIPTEESTVSEESTAPETDGTPPEDVLPDYNPDAAAEVAPETEALALFPEDGWTAEELMPQALSAAVLYRDVYPGVDLRYTACSYNLKEQIILREPQSRCRYDFLLTLTGLTAALAEDGSAVLQDPSGETLYRIPAPYMEDARGVTSDAVSFSLTQTVEGAVLTVQADPEWLAQAAYPVTIDPTLISEVRRSAMSRSADLYATYVVQDTPNSTQGDYQDLYLGYGSYGKEHWGFFHFKTLPSVPDGAMVTGASLNLYVYAGSTYQWGYSAVDCLELPLELCEVTGANTDPDGDYYDWLYDMSWNRKPDVNTGNVLDYALASAASQGSYLRWDMTRAVKKWYAEGTENRTVAILPANRGTYSDTHCALVKAMAYSQTYTPVFAVTYRSTTGIEPYYTYNTLSAGQAGSACLADATGQLKAVREVASYASSVNPVSVRLVYNSDYFLTRTAAFLPQGSAMDFGSGWTLDWVQRLAAQTIGGTEYLRYTDGDGTEHYFRKDSSKEAGYFYDEDGLGLKIKAVSGGYEMSDDKDTRYAFSDGYLKTVTDANGNQIRMTYSGGRLTAVTQKNNGGSEITAAALTYSGSRLTAIRDGAGNTTTLSYTDGKLTGITRNGTALARYAYSGQRLSRMTDAEADYSLNFTYAGGRVSAYWEAGGSSTGAKVGVTYPGSSQTVYRDYGADRKANTGDDLVTAYLFDYAGRTVNAYTTDASGALLGAANAVYTGSGSTDKKNNRTQRTASIGTAARNLAANSGFESGGTGWTIFQPGSAADGYAAAVVSSGSIRTGGKAFKAWVRSGVTQTVGIYGTSYPLTAGKRYTLSAWVNTTQAAASSLSDGGLILKVKRGSETYTAEGLVNYQTSASIQDGWERISLSFTPKTSAAYEIGVYDRSMPGNVYIDDLQLEEGAAPSTHNLLENGSFTRGSGSWSLSGGATVEGGMLKMAGSPKANRNAAQTVTLQQPGSQSYVLSGWAKANSVPDTADTAKTPAEDHFKQFGLRAILTYSDGTTEAHYVPFCPDLEVWQFVSMAIVPRQPGKTVSGIQVLAVYEQNANTAYFDDLSLVREAAQTMKYDADGNLVSVSATGLKEETSAYDKGNLIKTVTGGYGTYSYDYDSHHNLTHITGDYVQEALTYDAAGNVTGTELYTTDENYLTTGKRMYSQATYTHSGNLPESQTDGRGNRVSYTYYDDSSRMRGIASRVETPRQSTRTVLADDDRYVLSSYVDGVISTKFSYTGGRLSRIERGGYLTSGGEKQFQYYDLSYDAFGNTTGVKIGSRSLSRYSYGSGNGPLAEQALGNGAWVRYTYDDLGRVRTESRSGGRTLSYTYNGDGRLAAVEDSLDGKTTYDYDSLGRLVHTRQENTSIRSGTVCDDSGRMVQWGYSAPGLSTTSQSFTYNAKGRLQKMGLLTGHSILYDYNALAQPIRRTVAEKLQEQYSYLAGAASGSTTGLVSAKNNLIESKAAEQYRYSYDAAGSISQVQELVSGAKTTYTYDVQGQLLTAENSDGRKEQYTYDTYGNLRSFDNGITQHTYTYGDGDWKDLLTALDGHALTYDAIGNPTGYYNGAAYGMAWTEGRRLGSVTVGGKSFTYTYDRNGIRSGKTSSDGSSRKYYLVDGKAVGETVYKANGSFAYNLRYTFDENGSVCGISYWGPGATAWTKYYFTKNLQGDVTAVYRVEAANNQIAGFTKVAAYTYDTWGNVLSQSGDFADVNPFRYRSYYYDTETGFYYVSSRYYDPEIGRWINADNAIAGVGGDIRSYNLFAYCMNDPVNMSDHTGHWPQWIKNAASAVVNAVVTVVANTVKSAVSSASNILKASSNSLPKKGEPGSSQTLPNPDGTPKQKRWYGPDGNPERDRDYNHPGNMPFPHDHEWKNGERGTEHLLPDPSYKMSWDPVIGAGLVVICTVGIIAVAADDLTGVGVADDFLFGPLGAGVGEGLIMIFG